MVARDGLEGHCSLGYTATFFLLLCLLSVAIFYCFSLVLLYGLLYRLVRIGLIAIRYFEVTGFGYLRLAISKGSSK